MFTLQVTDFPGVLDQANNYFPMLSTDNLRDGLARFLANELTGVRTRDIVVNLV
jgi:hypothetical protein